MNYGKKILAILISVLFFIVLIFILVFGNIMSKDDLKTVAWIPHWDQARAIESFRNHSDNLDFVSLFWYRIDSNGNLENYSEADEDLSFITLAQKKNVKALALVANLADSTETQEETWESQRVGLMISDQNKREKFITDLLILVNEKNFDGVDIDFEALEPRQREDYLIFIEELSTRLHKEDKILGVTIEPATREEIMNNDPEYAAFLKALSDHADHLYFMTYLEHGAFSNPGPLGSEEWVREVIDFAIQDANVAKNKIFMGIGLMGVSWRQENSNYTGENSDLTFEDIQEILETREASSEWDESAKSPKVQFTDHNGTHVIWFEDKKSVKARMDLAENMGVGGVGFWRLGGEDEEIWMIKK